MSSANGDEPRLREYLQALGADRVPHSGRSLLDHLTGTHELLQAWGCPATVCKAGMFHSIYGTSSFGFRCLELRDRELVARMLGADAERLVHLFCSSDRAFLGALEDGVLRLRDGAHVTTDAATLHALLQIECANLIEQGTGAGLLRELVDRFGAGDRECDRRMMADLARRVGRQVAEAGPE